jgi:muramoyltetrapeptide carboxypeptidase
MPKKPCFKDPFKLIRVQIQKPENPKLTHPEPYRRHLGIFGGGRQHPRAYPDMHAAPTAVIKPAALKPGNTIGVIAPSSPFDPQALERGLCVLQAMGYITRSAQGLAARSGFLAGDDAHRANQLHAMFADDAIHAIICARGGYGALRILSLLDYDLIRAHPKPFFGFSDSTVLHQALRVKTGLVTFHGPMVCTLDRGDGLTRASWQQAAGRDIPLVLESDAHRTIKGGRARGCLVGGNLTSLCHLVGTLFAVSYRNCILFIEDTGERPYRIDRMLVHMKLSGCFDGLSGVILGSFKNCGARVEIDGIVRQLFDDCDIPIMAGVAAGHRRRNLTLPLGIRAELDADNGTLRYLESATLG